jgi:hypothetical protein
MPYIPLIDRAKFDRVLDDLYTVVTQRGLSNGELNYLVTQLGRTYLRQHGTSYNTISDVVKALECAKLEFYRRVAAPYEDCKRDCEGEVFL